MATTVVMATTNQVARGNRDQQQFDGEGNSPQRGIEGRSDAGAGARGDEGDSITGRHPNELTQAGAKG